MAACICWKRFLNCKTSLFHIQKRTGYIILIPETPKEVEECNVISLENLPNYSKLSADICKQIVIKYIQQYNAGTWELNEHLEKVLKESGKVDIFKNVLEPLEVLSVPFMSSWGVVKSLFVGNSKCMPLDTFWTISDNVMQARNLKYNNLPIYTACKKQIDDEKNTEEQKRVLKKYVWEGFHNGFELNEKDKERLVNCNIQIHHKRKVYDNKLKAAKTLFKQLIDDPNFAKESPADLIRNTAMNPNKPTAGPWIITLDDSVYHRYMEYCSSTDARRHVWLNYNQLCSNRGDPRCNAGTDIEDIRRTRKHLASILGFPTYAHLSMKTKMAESVENLQNVLADMLEPAKYAQENELFELEKFAFENKFDRRLEMWDLAYWQRMERKLKYGLDEEVLKDYFPLTQVLLGLIALCEQLFEIEIEEQSDVDVWHPDVRYFRVSDAKTKNIIGGFYFDPYARSTKVVGDDNTGWFVAMRPRSKICASLPLSSLSFSFTPPTDETPSLLYYREVKCLFDKFGQMLQYTLTQTCYSEVAGTSNIEWDAVNISNHFLLLWLCEKGTLESISGHYNTGEPLPNDMLNNLCNVHTQLAGTKLCQLIYLSNLDLHLHLKEESLMDTVRNLWPDHFLFELHPLDMHPYGFKEIFSNSWAAAYYSDIWSRMLAADVFSAFVEVGFKNHEEIAQLGRRFRSTFFSLGGGCEPAEVFRRFRGRNPNPRILAELLKLRKPEEPAPSLAPELAIAE